MLKGLLMCTGTFLLYFVYGKEEYKRRGYNLYTGLGLSIVVDLWIMAVLGDFIGNFSNPISRIGCIIFTASFPIIVIVWRCVVRKRIKEGFYHASQKNDTAKSPSKSNNESIEMWYIVFVLVSILLGLFLLGVVFTILDV